MNLAANPRTLHLWRRILRSTRAFDDPAKKWYYRHNARGHIMSHSDEDDEERLNALLEKGEYNRRWILNKYKLKDPVGLPPPSL